MTKPGSGANLPLYLVVLFRMACEGGVPNEFRVKSLDAKRLCPDFVEPRIITSRMTEMELFPIFSTTYLGVVTMETEMVLC